MTSESYFHIQSQQSCRYVCSFSVIALRMLAIINQHWNGKTKFFSKHSSNFFTLETIARMVCFRWESKGWYIPNQGSRFTHCLLSSSEFVFFFFCCCCCLWFLFTTSSFLFRRFRQTNFIHSFVATSFLLFLSQKNTSAFYIALFTETFFSCSHFPRLNYLKYEWLMRSPFPVHKADDHFLAHMHILTHIYA